MKHALRQQTALKYPDTWGASTVDVYENLASMGKITQADVDEIEERLQWFRGWRDYFATTGGVDETLYPQEDIA